MRRFFVTPEQVTSDEISITGSDFKHLTRVLRFEVGQSFEIIDGTGAIYLVELSAVNKDQAQAKILSKTFPNSKPAVEITLAQCLPKGGKMDFIIKKTTELGVNKIIPVQSERSIPDLSGKEKAKAKRWEAVAAAAAKQSGRTSLPEIRPITAFKAMLCEAKNHELALIFYELEENNNFKSVLADHPKAKNILILVGPEGGLSQSEVQLAKENGFVSVGLGKNILRTETAPIAIISNLIFFYS